MSIEINDESPSPEELEQVELSTGVVSEITVLEELEIQGGEESREESESSPIPPNNLPRKRAPRHWNHRNCSRITILGAGGVGFWTAVGLAGLATHSLTVYDSDTFMGGTGHTRLPVSVEQRQYKVHRLKGFIQVVMGLEAPIVVPHRFTVVDAKKLCSKDLVIDCTDMGQQAREELFEAITAKKARYCRVSYDGNGVVMLSYGVPIAPIDHEGGYEMIPTLSQSLRAGGLGADWVKAILRGLEPLEMRVEIDSGGI